MSAGKRYSPAIVIALATMLAAVDATPQGIVVVLLLAFTAALVVAETERQKLKR